MNKTEWFDARKHNPVRRGLYEFNHCLYEYHYWTGKQWRVEQYGEKFTDMDMNFKWRGLTEKAK